MKKYLSLTTVIFILFICLPQFLKAQTGPGGVNTDLLLWLRGDAGVEEASADAAEDGDLVEFWRDQSGNNYDGDQGSAGFRPTFNSTSGINFNPVLSFDGNDNYFPIRDYNINTVKPLAITVYAVATTSSGSEGILLSYDRNQFFRFATDHQNDGGFGLSTTNLSGTTDDFNANGTPEDDGIPHILGGDFDPAVVGINKRLFFDGTIDNEIDAGTIAFGTNGTDRFGFVGVGSEASGFDGTIGPDNYFDGDIAEIFLYGTALSSTQRQQVETYLAVKYGVTLSADTDGNGISFEPDEGDYLAADGLTTLWDADVNSSYHFDIAAIGRDGDLNQPVSKSINADAVVRITENSLNENDYIVWGNNNASFGSSVSAGSSFERELNRVWKLEITDNSNFVDEIEIDLSSIGVLPENGSDIALLIDDNDGFTSPVEVSGSFVSKILTLSNVDFSSFGGDIFLTVAYNLKEPGGIATIPTFWFRADAGVEEAAGDPAEDGDGVSTWFDQSGNGFNGFQNNQTDRPSFSSSSTINNNPVLSFNGSSSHMPIAGLNYDLTTNTLDAMTIFSVVKSNQTDEGIIVSYDRSSFFRFALNHQNNPNFGLSTNVGTNIDDFNANSSAEDGIAHIVAGDIDVVANEKNLYLDGNTDVTRPNAHSPAGTILGDAGEVPRFGFIGANSEADSEDGSSNSYNFNGSIAEIIYYESILAPTDRLRIESYLALKYGISLPGNYVSSSGATIWDATANSGYLNNIAGLGVDQNTVLNQTESQSEEDGSILAALESGLTDGEYIIWGHDGDGLSFTSSGTGSKTERIEREWKFQVTGGESVIDQLTIDLSDFVLLPSQAAGDYSLLVDDAPDFSSPVEIAPNSLVNSILTFTNVDVSSNIYVTLALDPDLDGDGVADANDLDQDNDGIPNIDEGSGTSVDTDGDGIADFRDLDSDNDGIGDLYESGAENSGTALTALDTDDDGVIDVAVGTNGLADALETNPDIDPTLLYTINDDDSDGIVDFRDLDSDNNGLSDLGESGQAVGQDTDDNGVFDSGTDIDSDGISDEIDSNPLAVGSNGLSPRDLDGNGTPDFRDLDNDNDGIFDVVEFELTDDGAGRLDLTGQTDTDGDGVYTTDSRDSDDGQFGFINVAGLLTGTGTDWYSYRSGDWTDPDNWTQDPSGTTRINPGGQFPNNVTENVTILNGDEMTLDFNNLILTSLTVNNGGILNLGSTNNHSFGTISGRGRIRLSSDDFPAGDASAFIATTGGTVEYTEPSPVADYELTIDRTFNNVIVNSNSSTVVLKADYTLNGNLTISSGTLQINDDTGDLFVDNLTPLDLVVNGDMTIDPPASITVGDVDASSEIGNSGIFTFHEITLLGDLTNNGTLSFTNLSPTSISDGRYRDKYPTASDDDNNTGSNDIPAAEFGVVELLLTNGLADQLVTLNGPSDFYRIEVNKGTSQTFIAEINASSTANFRLLGRIAMDMSDDSDDTPNIDNNRALGLEAGILKLGDNIVINQISKDDPNGSDATTQGGNRNYIIDLDAQLWLASNSQITKSNDWGIHPFGKLKVSDNATLNFTGTGQRTILIDNQGVYEQTGGTVNVTQFRNKTGADGAPRGSFIMTGGTLNVGQGAADGNHGIFSVPWADQNFILKASDPANPPTINITLDGNRGKDRAAIQIGVADGNYDVGESNINVIHTSNRDYKISSTAPLYNLTYNNSNSGELIISDIEDARDDGPGAGGVLPDDNSGNIPSPAQFALPLLITNDFTIVDGRFDANNEDVTIGNLFTIGNGGQYDPGLNNTLFNGSSPIQRISISGASAFVGGGFYDLSFTGSGTEKDFIGTETSVTVLNNLSIGPGVTLNDNGRSVTVNGDLDNSGTHITDFASPGNITISGGAAPHEIGGDGNGRFSILTIDDAVNAISLTADQQIDSILNLVNGVLDIGINGLTINSTATDPIRDDVGGTGNFNNTRMIQVAGNDSDAGLSILFDDTETQLYPIGTDANLPVRYTPVLATVDAAGDSGYVAINVVDLELALLNQTIPNEALTYYWKSSNSVFSGSRNVDYVFTFVNAPEDVPGGEDPATEYTPGWVQGTTRIQDPGNPNPGDGMTATTITTSNHNLINAKYTAAAPVKYTGTVRTVYAIRNGEWHDPGTWSDTPDGAPFTLVSELPGPGDVVQIGDSDENFAVAICDGTGDDCSGTNYAPVTVAQVSILREVAGESSILTIDETAASHNLGIVTNRAPGSTSVSNASSKFAISGPTLPSGDFGEFTSAPNAIFVYSLIFPATVTSARNIVKNGGGTVARQEVPSFTMGNSLTEYPILQFESSGGTGSGDITFPDVDITVNNDVRFFNSGGFEGIIKFNSAGSIVTVVDDFTTNNDNVIVEFPASGNPSTLTILGDLDFSNETNTIFQVENAAGSLEHSLQIQGNILSPSTSSELNLFRNSTSSVVNLEFIGESDSDVPQFTQSPELNRIIMNKGTDQTYSATINSDFNLNATSIGSTKALGLINGTLILNNAGIDIDVNSGTGDFTIPETAALEIQSGTVRVTASGTGVGNGIRLNGKLTVSGGDVILDGGATADNYIEYGSAGGSEIELSSGNLVVGSQLRRNLFSDDGVIQYNQSGGTAIFGANLAPDDSRGVFEIINTGVAGSSSLTIGSGSFFAIVNGQASPAIGTFIIDDDVSTNIASDAIIDFGYDGTIASVTYQNDPNETYAINSSVAIPNIRIDSANLNNPIVSMVIQPLTVSNNLQILNGGTLQANGINLTVNEGFTNNGTYTPGLNTTIFNGGVQSILGSTSTTFNNLDVNVSTSLMLANTITVDGDLRILQGQLSDDGNRIAVNGNLTVLGEHVSDGTGNGGLSLQNPTDPQTISLPLNSAEIDHLIIDNTEGVTLFDNSGVAVILTIDQELELNDGVFLIGDNRLVLDDDAAATTTSSFTASRMISVNGVKKSDGVEKQFLASTDYPSFEIPIGTPDKYTPVFLDVDASDDPGSVLVKPINAIHPSADAAVDGDPGTLDALNYYWVVSSSTVNNFLGSISFEYLDSDANEPGQGQDEASWTGVRLIAPNWSKPPAAEVDEINNLIIFDQADLADDGDPTTFDGEFTAGGDIPDILAQYRSNTTGIWNLAGNWDIENDGDGDFNDGNGIPQPGTQVIVRAADEITMSSSTDNDQNVFSVEIEGILDVDDSDGHNFGEISGAGTLRISNATLPGGNYDEFFRIDGGILDLSGAASYTISPDFTSLRGLVISGGGTKTLPAITLSVGTSGIDVNDGAVFDNNTYDNSISVNGEVNINNGSFLLGTGSLTATNLTLTSGTYSSLGGSLDLSGSLTLDGGTFNAGNTDFFVSGDFTVDPTASFNNGSGRLVFDGSSNQNIDGDFSSNTLQNLRVAKSGGQLVLAANADVVVDNILNLDGGNINTTASGATLRLTNGVGSYVRTSGFIIGPLQVDLNDDDAFIFPLGRTAYKPLRLKIQNGSQSSNPLTWEVEYYNQSATTFSSAENSGIDLNAIEVNSNTDEQVETINGGEFWRMDTQTGTAIAETITLDLSNSGVNQDNINDQLLQVMVWDNAGSEWDHLGGVSSGTPTAANTISTFPLSFSEKILTSGAESNITLPVTLVKFTGSPEKDHILLEWTTSTEIDNDYFEIQHAKDGENFEIIGIVQGNGNTNELIDYSFPDYSPFLGVNYYRFRQVDFDGNFEFSPIIRVDFDSESNLNLVLYPNPVIDNEIKIKLEGYSENINGTYIIHDLMGRKVSSGRIESRETKINLEYLSEGQYFLKVHLGDKYYNHKILKN